MAAQKATCPLCLCDLCDQPQQVGALTLAGRRVEGALYHKNCICGEDGCPRVAHSPVSRQRVNGFLSMPPLSEFQRWVAFVDWNGDGRLTVNELSQAIAAILPVDENSCEQSVTRWFDIDQDGWISMTELLSRVLPWLAANVDNPAKIANARRSAPVLTARSSHSSCEQWFDHYDADGNRSLDVSEFYFAITTCFFRTLGLFSVDLDTQECIILSFLQEADADGDGTISKQEFMQRLAPMLLNNLSR